MWLRTLYLTFYGYLGHDMVKLSCLLLKSIVEPYTRLITCICVCTIHLTFVFHTSHSSPTVSHSEITSHLSHMWLRTLYLTFYGYLGHDMVKLSCLLLKSIVEPYDASQHMYICISHAAHIFVFLLRHKKNTYRSVTIGICV